MAALLLVFIEPGVGPWAVLPALAALGISAAASVRARRWVRTVRAALDRPAISAGWVAHGRWEPLRHYPNLPGRRFFDLADPAAPHRVRLRVPLMDGQRAPAGWKQGSAVTVVTGPRPRRPIAIVADVTLAVSAGSPKGSRQIPSHRLEGRRLRGPSQDHPGR